MSEQPVPVTTGHYKGRPLGRILIRMNKVNRAQVAEALSVQKTRRGPLGQILIDLGYITDADLQFALAAQLGMESVDLDQVDIDDAVIRMMPAQMAHTYKVIPISHDVMTNTLTIAMSSPENFHATDDLRTMMGFMVKAMIAREDSLQSALNRYYPEDKVESINDLIEEMAGDEDLANLAERGASLDLDELAQAADSPAVIRLLNLVLLQAIREKASDIHFEPFEEEYKMRYRVDGVLLEITAPPRHLAIAIASRIKVMANLDIAERRLPQDGRVALTINQLPVDLRVAILPTMFGESVVLRVLDRSNVNLDLEKLGFREDDLANFRRLINRPHGVIINTGPTGSGKTTTLYAALNELNDMETKILTAEDPVEYDIDGLVQVQVNPEIGLTFGRALRSFLRMDPDVILVGEVRDLETAQISVQASLTGHLVFTTLHTNDAPSAVARLLDLGLEPFLMTATIEGIVAQRLVRRICVNCKEEFHPTEEMLMELSLRPEDVKERTFYFGRGCDDCSNTGYRGRLGLYEIMVLDDEMRDLIMKHASTNVLRAEARKRGMRTLREAGLLAIFDGVTSLEEVVRETLSEDLE